MPYCPIVLVGDDEDDFELVKEAVAALSLPHSLLHCQKGEELRQILEGVEERPCFILCDWWIGRGQGLRVLEEIQALKKEKRFPFLFWSTTPPRRVTEQAHALGAEAFFTKPTTFQALCDLLQKMVDNWTADRYPGIN